ncbi:MAG: tungstate ABC transporter substrate-binding protein WtpA [Proteobacteria bacterium]|nr:tungstate ABC transporter substrate-binding protein WtpA [Pseudomonadota bacterium]
MSDRSTYIYLSKEVNLDILFEGDPSLVNHYNAIAVNPAKYPERNYELAINFIGFITSPAGQKIIRDYGKKEFGLPLYFADAIPSVRVAGNPTGKVIIFHAGSLTIPFVRMEKEFEARYLKVDIQREPAGSQKCARKISDLKKPCDIMASADYKVIDKLLIPDCANWNIRFATNQLVLCYTDTSKYGSELTSDNWYEILLKKDAVWGHSDPNLDPCGYRSLMVMQLAENHYKKPGLYNRLLSNRPRENIRPKSVELISLLQTGNMDYAWEYLSVAVQHGLKYIILPDEVNLGNYQYDNLYKQAAVKVTGKKPGTHMEIKGKSVTYGITLVKDAPNQEAAIAFLEYLLDPQGGLKILQEMGQPPFVPCRVPTAEIKSKLPAGLKNLVEIKK